MALNIGLKRKASVREFFDRRVFPSIAVWEWSFAIISGIFIFLGWILSKLDLSIFSITSYLIAYGIGGFFKAKEGIQDTLQTKKLNVELLMVLAAIGSAFIGYWEEGAILIFIFALSGALETYTMSKSKKELTSLLKMQPEEAWLFADGKEIRIPVKQLKVGDLIIVKPGEQIPADGLIKKGRTNVNESVITGESIPVEKAEEDEIFAGTMNGSGAIIVEITKPNNETLFQKIIQMVQNAQTEKSPSQQFIDRFESVYVNVVLIAVVLLLIFPHYIFEWDWNESFYRAMVFLVVASPCAIVASITPAALSAISTGARNGILVKGSSALELLSKAKVISFDKTGTITKGTPEVTDFYVRSPYDERDVLEAISAIEANSNHPLAQAVLRFSKEKGSMHKSMPDYVEDVSGFGIKAKFNQSVWKIGKDKFMSSNITDILDSEMISSLLQMGKTVVYIERDNELLGLMAFKDTLRPEAKNTIMELKKLGVEPMILTGDNHFTARTIAQEAGIEKFVSECLPQNKVQEIEKLKKEYDFCAMVGDGINDAPALAASHIGIAMGEGTDVALETADLVLMKNDLSKIPKAIQISRKMNRIVKQNLLFSASVIVVLIMANFFQSIDLPLGVIGHEGSTILVILNSLRLLKD